MSGRQSGSVDMHYDKQRDVLYIALGSARPAYGIPDEELPNVILRYDLETNELVGATIVRFSLTDHTSLQAHIPFPVDFDWVK